MNKNEQLNARKGPAQEWNVITHIANYTQRSIVDAFLFYISVAQDRFYIAVEL